MKRNEKQLQSSGDSTFGEYVSDVNNYELCFDFTFKMHFLKKKKKTNYINKLLNNSYNIKFIKLFPKINFVSLKKFKI